MTAPRWAASFSRRVAGGGMVLRINCGGSGVISAGAGESVCPLPLTLKRHTAASAINAFFMPHLVNSNGLGDQHVALVVVANDFRIESAFPQQRKPGLARE